MTDPEILTPTLTRDTSSWLGAIVLHW